MSDSRNFAAGKLAAGKPIAAAPGDGEPADGAAATGQPSLDLPTRAAEGLSHFDSAGQAHMVDVGAKPATDRFARAGGCIRMQATTLDIIRAGTAAKGDVLGVARIAAIQASKRTAELIPLCHPLPISAVSVEFTPGPGAVLHCEVTVRTHGPTGVEMEALTAVQVGLLTVYDMCKAVDRGMVIDGVRLLEKRGGRSGDWKAARSAQGESGI